MDRKSSRLTMALALAFAASATAACGAKPPTDAATPSTTQSGAPSTPDKPGDSAAPKTSSDTPASTSSAAAPKAAAPASDEYPVSDVDPGDSGAFNLGAQHTKPIVDANRPLLNKSCWANAVKENPNGPAKTKLVIELEIQPDGKVTKTTMVGGKEYQGFSACVEKQVKRWRFPRAKAVSSAMFPLEFSHGDVEWKIKEKK
ncbi:MAG: hypothetical protein HY898_09810 [Deltaproteobacteria bacterium]|nr:hypothetical protein [Deltaproteobacteria bacterium]